MNAILFKLAVLHTCKLSLSGYLLTFHTHFKFYVHQWEKDQTKVAKSSQTSLLILGTWSMYVHDAHIKMPYLFSFLLTITMYVVSLTDNTAIGKNNSNIG